MDEFESWRSRNLARTILAQVYAHVIQRQQENSEEAERRARPVYSGGPQRRHYSERRTSVPYYRRFSRRSSSSCSDRILDRARVFVLRQRSPFSGLSLVGDSTVELIPDSTDSSDSSFLGEHSPHTAALMAPPYSMMVRNPSLFGTPTIAYYRRFSRHSSRGDGSPIQWATSGHFTSELGRQKIVEYINKKWTRRAKTSFVVEHICAVPLPGITRHKYSATFRSGRYSSTIYFSIDVSTVYIRRPVKVTFTFPDGKRAHRVDTPRAHFDNFLRTLYPYGREK